VNARKKAENIAERERRKAEANTVLWKNPVAEKDQLSAEDMLRGFQMNQIKTKMTVTSTAPKATTPSPSSSSSSAAAAAGDAAAAAIPASATASVSRSASKEKEPSPAGSGKGISLSGPRIPVTSSSGVTKNMTPEEIAQKAKGMTSQEIHAK